MSTAADLIKSSLRAIGAIASGETPSAADQADALDITNDILEEWSNDGFMIFENKIEEFTFTPNVGAYEIGSGATFNTARPQLINFAKVKRAGDSYEYPLDVWSAQRWASISIKDLQCGLPEGVFYNPTVPSGTLNFWPVPNAADKIVLYSIKPLNAIPLASTTLVYPPGYKKALKYALATELAPEYGKEVSAKLESLAINSKLGIQRTNTEEVLMQSDAFGLNECGGSEIFWRPII